MSELALQLIAENKKTRNPYLDLGNCGLTHLPKELGECVWLETLVLSNANFDLESNKWVDKKTVDQEAPNWIASLEGLEQLVGLKSLIALRAGTAMEANWPLTDLSPLSQLLSLQSIDFRGMEVSDLSPLSGLLGLESLSFRWTNFSDLSPLRGLVGLQNLSLSCKSVSDLSPLGELVGLESLSLENIISVSDLSPLRKLVGLKSLSLENISVSDLSPLGELVGLKSLHLGDKSVSDLSPLCGLLSLQRLDLFHTSVSDLSPLSGLLGLQSLELFGALVSDLSPLSGLLALQSLGIGWTSVSDLNPISGLLDLRHLDFTHTLVRDLRPLKDLPLLNEIICHLCPIKTIPLEIAFSSDGQLIRNYLNSNPDTPFNEVKLILSGNTRAGKTNLADFLVQGEAFEFKEEHDSSHGVLVGRWEVEKAQLPRGSRLNSLTVNIWDFGGQDFYHGTHNLFFRHGAVYALLWEQHKTASGAAEDQCLPEDYWLEDIRHHASDHPVLVVQNKTDRDGQHRLPDEWLTHYDLAPGDEFHLSIKKAATQPDSEDRENWESFVKKLVRRLCVVPEKKEIKINHNWLKIRDYVRELQSGQPLSEGNPFSNVSAERPYLSTEEFTVCCTQVAEDFAQFADVFLKVFDQRGVLIHFDEHETLKNWVFLNPEWVTRRIYEHLLTKELLNQQGKFTRAYAQDRLGADTDLLLDLMLKYQVIFADPRQTDTFVAVQYLPKFDPNNDIDFHYEKLEKPWLEMRLPLFHQRRVLRQLTVRLGSDKSYRQHLLRHDCLLLAAPDRTLIRIEGLLDGSVGRLKIFAERPEWGTQMFLEVLMLYFEQQWEFGIPPARKFGRQYVGESAEREQQMLPFFNSVDDFEVFARVLDQAKNATHWGSATDMDLAVRPFELPNQPQVAKLWGRFFGENFQRLQRSWEMPPPLDEAGLKVKAARTAHFQHLSQSLHLSTNQAQNWVPFAHLIKTPQATEVADTNGHIVKTEPFTPLLKALGFETPKKPLRVFVSYSKYDRDQFVDPLLRYLSPLERGRIIQPWDDHKIPPGEEWDPAIRAQIEQADVILLLVSTNSLNTEYIWNVEIEAAMRRHDAGKAHVVPLILSDCLWTEKDAAGNHVFPPARLNALPSKGVPVTHLPKPETAWQAVADALKKIWQEQPR